MLRFAQEAGLPPEQAPLAQIPVEHVSNFFQWLARRNYISQQWADWYGSDIQNSIIEAAEKSLAENLRQLNLPAGTKTTTTSTAKVPALLRSVLESYLQHDPPAYQQYQRELAAYQDYMLAERRHQDILARLDRIGTGISESMDGVAASLNHPAETVVHLSPEALEALRQPAGSGTKQILFDRNAAGQVVAATAIDG